MKNKKEVDAEEGFNVIEETSFCPLIRLDWVASAGRGGSPGVFALEAGGQHSGAAEKLLKKKGGKGGEGRGRCTEWYSPTLKCFSFDLVLAVNKNM